MRRELVTRQTPPKINRYYDARHVQLVQEQELLCRDRRFYDRNTEPKNYAKQILKNQESLMIDVEDIQSQKQFRI